MKINWKIRFQNPIFIAQLLLSIVVPILGYSGLTVQDLTTWSAVGDMLVSAISNPYVLGLMVVSVWSCINDPTTVGLSDSENALNYKQLNK